MDMEPLPARDIVRVTLHPQQRRDLPPVIRVNIAEKDVPQGLAVGSFISLRSRLMPPAAAAVPGAYDFSRRAWFDEIGATGRALQPINLVLAAPDSSPSFRHRLSAHIQTPLDGGAGAIAAPQATGDSGRVDRKTTVAGKTVPDRVVDGGR